MKSVRLIQIAADGSLAEQIGLLPEAALEPIAGTIALYKRVGFEPPWTSYLALSGTTVVGICSFTSPARSGTAEIAYFTFPHFEGKGMGTAMALALIRIARSADPHIQITAQTLPQDNASTTILRKIGFHLAGERHHSEDGLVWEWRLPIERKIKAVAE